MESSKIVSKIIPPIVDVKHRIKTATSHAYGINAQLIRRKLLDVETFNRPMTGECNDKPTIWVDIPNLLKMTEEQSTKLFEELESQGYVGCSLDHTGEVMTIGIPND